MTQIENEPAIDSEPEIILPERFAYRVKNKLLGPPLNSERLAHETLGKPTALAVFASDCLSSSAYATEEILHVLIVAVGIGGFSLVVPITIALLVVLAFLILSYRQTIKAYPSAGGAYIVTRDNFGLLPAQVAGVALLTDYILTVSVSTAAGTAALTSIFPSLSPYMVLISLLFVLIIAYGNLKGTKESGRIFAIPTYFFVSCMGLLIIMGIYRAANGQLHPQSIDHIKGAIKIGTKGSGLLFGATLWVVLHAFASGGAAVTGVEAISNGVPAFRPPAWKNARTTLVIMGVLLGIMFLGLSILASKTHPVVYESGTPTVISQVGKAVFGKKGFGYILYLLLQAGTMLILVLAANTSFADFPRLASFHAGDNFMPRQLTKRGHRLVFSNGIITLAFSSIVLLIATGAKVDRLIPLYAIGVFTSFTLSQAGMAKHHITHKEQGWRWGLFVNGMGALLSFLVDVIIAITKFKHGAWVIILLVPIMVYGLVRLNRQYEEEDKELERDAQRAAEAKALRRHVVIVLVDQLNVAAARAMQYAKTLNPDELRAVHFDIDPIPTRILSEKWSQLGLSRFALEIIECPDRRLGRASLELAVELIQNGDTEVSVVLPRLEYKRVWHRFLHDRSANRVVRALSQIPHCNVTIIPYHFGTPTLKDIARAETISPTKKSSGHLKEESHISTVPGKNKIGGLQPRQHADIEGVVHSLRVQPWAGVAALECVVDDGTGRIPIVFLGRRQIAGVVTGSHIHIEGIVGVHLREPAILNPKYEILSTPQMPVQTEHH